MNLSNIPESDATSRFICDDLSMHIFRNKGNASCSIDLQVAPAAIMVSKVESRNNKWYE